MSRHNPKSPLITYNRLGRTYVRMRPTHVSNPRTPEQTRNRDRFALSKRLMSQYLDTLPSAFSQRAYAQNKRPCDVLTTLLISHCIHWDEDSDCWTADPAAITQEIGRYASAPCD